MTQMNELKVERYLIIPLQVLAGA